MDRYRKEVLQVSTRKHGINVQYLYDKKTNEKTHFLENFSIRRNYYFDFDL